MGRAGILVPGGGRLRGLAVFLLPLIVAGVALTLHDGRMSPEEVARELAGLGAGRQADVLSGPADLVGSSGTDGRLRFDDELLNSPMLRDPAFLAEVADWVRFWETRHTRWFPSYLERMTWFADSVDAVLASRELPWSLRYLPVIESGYSPTAVSSAKAVGLWQFMEPTARDLGMEVSADIDQRRDPFRSTEAAADFLTDLRRDFGSWFLALAAYNAGPQRIRGILRRHAAGAVMSDSLYWAVRRHLPKETRDFVPKLMAAMVVAENPEAYGYRTPEPRPFAFDRILVVDRTSLSAVARVAGSTLPEIERLNPQYIRGATPSRRNAYVRVPIGSAALFRPLQAEGS